MFNSAYQRFGDLSFAAFIRARRRQLRMPVSYAADLAGIRFSQWLDLENGWVPARGAPCLYSVAGTLKVSTKRLLQLADASRTEAA